jgi:hypothetical protein
LKFVRSLDTRKERSRTHPQAIPIELSVPRTVIFSTWAVIEENRDGSGLKWSDDVNGQWMLGMKKSSKDEGDDVQGGGRELTRGAPEVYPGNY